MTSLIEKKIDTQPEEREAVISVENVSKKFCRDLKRSLFYGVQDIATEVTGRKRNSGTLRKNEFWALHDVSFKLHKGEALGLVGSNGAGKSTILRIISGLIKPDTGTVKVKGRVAPLIALGAGFNPILSGRENIYANMSILGLPTAEIEKKFDQVVEFAEIADAIDAPVQTYSSGMAARLGFACAVHIEPDILLIDEVLAVGDVKFKMKCHRKLSELRKKGTAFILVTHNSHSILNICESSIYLKKGQLISSGDTEQVIRKYEEDLCLSGKENALGRLVLPPKPKEKSNGLDIVSLCFKDEQDNNLETLFTGEPAYLSVECKSYEYIKNANLGMLVTALSGGEGLVLYMTSTSDNQDLEIPAGKSEIRMHMPYCSMIPGVYSARIYIRSGVYSYDIVESFRFTVKANKTISRCQFYQPRTWQVVSKSQKQE
ncbi:ABC-type polysaccharide/polyol phosphate transport system, ATPase component [Rivularia sp. PCC 7116]|uniref:ABC transporter ATP-binding protein n=1 Tax=Rivularia sp. PCC 7116 TaxID=373994 RepID=UPI00029EDCF1|nr:ABC transporter ATP-binding protein [Rivularia sp. PCC 7116]AFY56183.1 ABC-type polysaccharide/polyol phosphate transport system, ATPase component [Rivularia sp. PCC 7116]